MFLPSGFLRDIIFPQFVSANREKLIAIPRYLRSKEQVMDPELTSKYYEMLAMMLDDLIDVVGENENHILVPLMDLIGELIETYEDKHVPELAKIS